MILHRPFASNPPILGGSIVGPLASGLAMLAIAWVGLVLGRDTGGIAACWPANAILLSVLMTARRPARLGHVVAAATAMALANRLSGIGLGPSVIIALANVAAACLAFVMIGTVCEPSRTFEDPAFLWRFLRAIGCGAVACATIVAIGQWFATGSFAAPWLSSLTSDFLGLLLFPPIVVPILDRCRGAVDADRRWAFGWRLWPLGAVLVTSVAVFEQSRFPLLFLPLAVVMIATYRLGLLGAAGGTLIVATLGSALMATTGHGPIALITGPLALRIEFFQFYILTVYATAMPLAALLAERARLARERAENERLYRLLADNSNDMIVHLDPQGVRRYVSPASRTLLGFAPEEMVAQAAAGAIHPDDRASVVATCRTLLGGAENPMCSYRQLHKDGHYVWLEASYRLLHDETTGLPAGFIASVRDIARRTAVELERTRAAAELESANRLLLMAEEMSAVGHWRADAASGTVYWSDMVCKIHGQPSGYMPALQTAIDAYHPDDRAMIERAVAESFATGQPYAMDARLIRTDGVLRRVIMTGRAEIGPDGSITGLFGVFQDITDAHEAQQALVVASDRLTASNRMLTMAEAVANLGHWRIDTVAQTLFWSAETYRIYGMPENSSPSLDRAFALYHPDDTDRVRQTLDAALAARKGHSSRARIIRPDGSERHIQTRGEIELDADGKPIGLFGIVQDVTDQVEAEAERQAQAEKYVLITDQASDMITLTDDAGVCHFVSPSSKNLLGYDPGELIGKTAYDLVPSDDYPLLAEHARALAARLAGEVVPLRVRMARKDGVLVWIDIGARIASRGAEGRVISVCRDVTAQVAVEEQLRVAQAEAEAAVRAKSSFLANMSHEIRTPMNGVMGFAELLLASDLDPEQRRQAELITDSSRAMMRLLNDILDLSKIEAGQMTVAAEPFDLAKTLTACARLVTPAVEQKGLTLRCDLAANVPTIVTGDALRVRQIVLNLLGNATKFTLAGTITLAARLTAENSLAIDVVDTGIGIAADRQQAIFEQFVQADQDIAPQFGGTGLGLSISNNLAALMGGRLELDSEVGRGTRFTLHLPVGAAQPVRTDHAVPAPGSMGPSLRDAKVRILVADDHDVNQLLMTAMLGKLGCKPDLAADGAEAVAMVGAAVAAREPYSLVFMDMQMPVLDGVEATRRIRSTGVDEHALPIVAMTANAYADDIATCLAAGMQAHIAKPLSLATLEAALRQWLPDAPIIEPAGAARFSTNLQDRYRARREEMLLRLDRLVRVGTFTDAELADIASMLHKLVGTAEMFGDVTLGVKARQLETGLATWSDAERNDRIVSGVQAIQRAA